MGQLAQAAQGAQLAQARPQDNIKTLLNKAWPRIAAVMPGHMSSERLYQLALSAINQTPKLVECTPASILSCLMKCSANGLEPSNVDGLGRAYIVPYFNRKAGKMEATFILGYKGVIELAHRSGKLLNIHAQAVYRGDTFEYWEDESGQHFSYRPNLTDSAEHTPDNLTHVYVTAALKDGGRVFEHMTKAEVDAIRKRSKASNSGPWVTDYEAMALKTVIKRSARYLPMSTEAASVVAADETTPNYNSVFNPVVEQPAPAQVEADTGEIIEEAQAQEVEADEIEIAAEDIPFPGEE